MELNSMLAAVRAAATEPAFADADVGKGTAPNAGSQQTENPMAEKTSAAASQPKTETVADLKAAYPELCAEVAAEAAKLERERIQGILALPARGHEKIVANAIADAAMTKADVALQILEAEKATREKRLDNIQAAEAVATNVNAAPTAQGASETLTVPQSAAGWKAEYERSAELQAEFSSADVYVAFKKAEASGQARRLTRSA